MQVVKRSAVVVGLTAIVISLCSWGFLVHHTTTQLAIYELPKAMQPFFYKSMKGLVKDCTRPDERRNTDATEATKHFVDMEAYGDSAAYKMPFSWDEAVKKYTKDTLLKYGYVPYHIMVMKDKLTEAFKAKDTSKILFYAADIAHYIEDAHVPLHTSINYDGQLTNQKGLHALWESVTPEVELGTYNLRSKHKATYLANPEVAVWADVRGTYALLADVFAKEKEVSKKFPDSLKYKTVFKYGRNLKYYTEAFAKAYGESLHPTINQQLIKSADMVADFWYTAWVDAGKPDLDVSFSKAERKQKRQSFRSFKRNHLLQDSLLLAKTAYKPE
jgi:hypothetical protein